MSTKDITLESVINIMLECLHSFQNDGDKEGIIEESLFFSIFSHILALNQLKVYRGIHVEKVNNSMDIKADYSKVLTAFIGR